MAQSIHCSIKSASCRIHDNNTLIVIDSSDRRQTWSETTHQLKCRRTHSLIQLLFKPYYKRFLPANFPILKKFRLNTRFTVYSICRQWVYCHGEHRQFYQSRQQQQHTQMKPEKKFVQCKSHFSCRVEPINLT